MKITVNVTEQHIVAQLRGDCYSCAVALAISDVVQPEYEAYVDGQSFRLENGPVYALRRNLPLSVRERIYDLDWHSGKSCINPFSFETDIPRKYLRKPEEKRD